MHLKKSSSLIAVLIFLFTTNFLGCASKNKISNANVSFEAIYFGKSGGFTNLMERYAIKNNGAVCKIIEGEEKEIGRIKKSQLRKIDQKLNTLNYQTISLDEVGNMTYFIEVKSDDYSNKVTWTDLTDQPDIKALYNVLISTFLKPKR